MSDPAAFRPRDVHAVYGERPKCWITLHWQFVDAHHILGRGYVNGYRPNDVQRKMFSSVFNFCPLQRDIHKGPQKDSPEMRHLFLRLAREHVMQAVSEGRYELRPEDEAFLAFADNWISNNPV